MSGNLLATASGGLHHALGGMREVPQWFVWRLQWDGVEAKYQKTPCAHDGSVYRLDGADPSNWGRYESVSQVVAALNAQPQCASRELQYALGFWMTEDCGYWFFDLDKNAHGALAQQFVAAFPGALVESSSSGRGVHVFGRVGAPIPPHRTKPERTLKQALAPLELEFYHKGRGVAFGLSGEATGSADTVHDAAVSSLLAQYFPPIDEGEAGEHDEPRADWRGPADDDELIRRALNARVSAEVAFGGKPGFAQLWRGECEKSSESDMALAAHLAFWTGCDAPRIERLMRASGLVRDKWNSHRTYLRDLTIQRACDGCDQVYRERGPQPDQPQGTPGSRSTLDSLSHLNAAADGIRVVLARGDQVSPEAVDWIWHHWLAAGKLHLIGGAPGCGKTTLACSLAAIVTAGQCWPDQSPAARGSVVIWSGEDDIANVLVPRMIACGADMTRVHFVAGVEANDVRRMFDPAKDLAQLEARLKEIPDLRMVIVDPIVSAVDADSHKNSETRRGLQPLVDLCARHGCALIGITHFTKGTQGRDPVERITGSLAFAALARVVLVAAAMESDDGRPPGRVLLRAKSNLGPNSGGFEYSLDYGPLPGHPGVTGSRVIWRKALQGSARALLATSEAVAGRCSTRGEAKEWLADLLSRGPVPADVVKKEGAAAGHSFATIRRAKDELGVRSRKAGEGWVWVPAGQAAQPAQGVQAVGASRPAVLALAPPPIPNCGTAIGNGGEGA